MTQTKDTELKKLGEYQDNTFSQIANINELLNALGQWDKKVIDKRFFLAFFKVSNEYRDWTKYSFVAPQFDWQNYNYRLYIGKGSGGDYIELITRNKDEIVQKLLEKKATLENWAQQNIERIEKLNTLNEDELVADILAVYEKHGKPDIWRDILQSYAVKYPN